MRTAIITSEFYATVCSVVRGSDSQIAAIIRRDPDAHGFRSYSPSDWDYRGDVIQLGDGETNVHNACADILKGVAQLPAEHRWLSR